MDKILIIIAERLFQLFWPKFLEWAEKKWDEIQPDLMKWVGEKFDEFAPKILKTILVGITTSAGQLTVNTTDKVTEIIPGPVDDFVVDQLVDRARDRLGQFGVRF